MPPVREIASRSHGLAHIKKIEASAASGAGRPPGDSWFCSPAGSGGPRPVVGKGVDESVVAAGPLVGRRKYIMALTGLGLMIFVLGHMSGNLLIFGGKDALNSYAHGLTEHPVLLWTARGGLLTIFVIHLLLAFRLTQEDAAAAHPLRLRHHHPG